MKVENYPRGRERRPRLCWSSMRSCETDCCAERTFRKYTAANSTHNSRLLHTTDFQILATVGIPSQFLTLFPALIQNPNSIKLACWEQVPLSDATNLSLPFSPFNSLALFFFYGLYLPYTPTGRSGHCPEPKIRIVRSGPANTQAPQSGDQTMRSAAR